MNFISKIYLLMYLQTSKSVNHFPFILQVLNNPLQTGRFNFTTQFPYYKQVLYKPDLRTKKLGKPVIFDMDMSAGDFIALFYLLKVPMEVINLKVRHSILLI